MNRLKKLKRIRNILALLSVLLTIGPAIGFSVVALVGDALIIHKVTLTLSIFGVLVMTAISAINKVVFRSRIWIILFTLFIALDNILTPVLVIGICQILDEVIVSPLHRKYKNRVEMRKEILT